MCNDHELIVGFVYGELSDAERRAFEAHITRCAACRNEVAELRATRGHLASWAPPEPDFGFRIVRGNNASAPPPHRWFARAWGLAAAAVLVMAAAAAIANVEVRYDATGFSVRTGWAGDAAPPGAASADGRTAQLSSTPDSSQSQIAALEARLRELESAARENVGAVQVASGPRMSEAEIIRRVREIVSQSETRQQREFAQQIAQVVSDVDRARKMDFLQIQQGMGRLRGATQADVAHQINYYLTRVSQEK